METLVTATPLGQFSFVLDEDHAPATSNYFRTLARERKLSGCCIFRIIADVNRQPDDSSPINVLQVGPVERFSAPRHAIAHEPTGQTGLTHRKWTVSAARFDPGELYGSFFVCMRDELELDEGGNRQPDGQGFAAFGRVVDGFDVLESIYGRAESDEMLAHPIPVTDVSLGKQIKKQEP